MARELNRRLRTSALILALMLAPCLAGPCMAQAPGGRTQITTLRQLTETLSSERRVFCDVRLEVVVCAASSPELGILIVQDETAVELLQLGTFEREILPGEKIRFQGWHCLLRKRDLGIEMSIGSVIDNDGLHTPRTWGGHATLKAGLVPLRLDWFNNLRTYHLEVFWVSSNGVQKQVESSELWHAVVDGSGRTNFLPGLQAECFEGYWEAVPDFELLKPTKTGIVTNFDLGFRTRDEMVGMRFTGYLQIPYEGRHVIRIRSDDGSLMFLGRPEIPFVRFGRTNPPEPRPGSYGARMETLQDRQWVEMEGRAGYVAEKGRGVEFDLRSDRDSISVRVADAAGLDSAQIANARVRVRGLGQGLLTADQRIVLGKISVVSGADIALVREMPTNEAFAVIEKAGQVQSMPIEDARRELPVRIRGVVTEARNSAYEHWASLQDDTRGIFVSLRGVTPNASPKFGEFWEIEGRTGAGDFAPIVNAEKVTLLGEGRLPEPALPTWTELLNGSMDVQWAELQGLVSAVQGSNVTLLLPEGRLEVQMDRYSEWELKRHERTVVRIRGVLYALWNADTRQVRIGKVLMRNGTIAVHTPAPVDAFDAVLKKPRELLLFDAQATPFRRVKVRGQIIYADAARLVLQEDGMGLRLWPIETVTVRPGDVVEAVGYLDIDRKALLLSEVLVRKIGAATLPAARKLSESELTGGSLDSGRVRVEGKLLGWRMEQGAAVLEMQSGARLYPARLAPGESLQSSLRPGSRLALEGVFVESGRNQHPVAEAASFEMLLNSAADISVLSQPPWWTLQRLLVIVGILLVGLTFSVIWIRQLRKQVEQRTAQLQHEIREREHIERQHALETERSRIARDLHDDLGSSLTEINVLANTGLRRPESGVVPPPMDRSEFDRASHNDLFHAIAGKAHHLVTALDAIVWAVDPEDNSLQSLADYLCGYAADFFSHTNISCRFKVPVSFPDVTLDGRVRHDLLMVVKETLNNIVRHAEATQVEFSMSISKEGLEIVMMDDGKGFEGRTERDGYGLKNLTARLASLGGTCAVESRIGAGTTISLRLPLPLPAKT
jgi:signal transduction histidine kinase